MEKALVARINYIIVEPARLGDETARWITVGNCLHKTAVISGLASIVSVSLWPDRLAICAAPLCAISVFCTGLYTVSWNYDPCVQYQVRKDGKFIQHLVYVGLCTKKQFDTRLLTHFHQMLVNDLYITTWNDRKYWFLAFTFDEEKVRILASLKKEFYKLFYFGKVNKCHSLNQALQMTFCPKAILQLKAICGFRTTFMIFFSLLL